MKIAIFCLTALFTFLVGYIIGLLSKGARG